MESLFNLLYKYCANIIKIGKIANEYKNYNILMADCQDNELSYGCQ